MRSASEPFAIHLEQTPYILSQSALKSQVDSTLLKKKDWFFPRLRFLSLESKTIKLQNGYKNKSYVMTVHIEPDILHFSCSCATPVESLCIHIYKALEHLTWNYSTDYFEKFKPGGLMEIAIHHRKYFVRKSDQNGIDFSPKKALGSIYQLMDDLNIDHISTILSLQNHVKLMNTVPPKIAAVAYMIMTAIRDRYLPFPLPCLGVLNDNGSNIKSFYPYLSRKTAEGNFADVFSPEEIAINQTCFEMHKLVKESPGSIINKNGDEHSVSETVYKLWKEILPLLTKQEYVFLDDYYGERYLKEKPGIRSVRRVTILMDTPKLHFQLVDKGSFYQLQMKITINRNKLFKYNVRDAFFVGHLDRYYLLGSVRDAAMVKWMGKNGGFITVFKEHFADFEKEILSPIWNSYDIVHYKNTDRTS